MAGNEGGRTNVEVWERMRKMAGNPARLGLLLLLEEEGVGKKGRTKRPKEDEGMPWNWINQHAAAAAASLPDACKNKKLSHLVFCSFYPFKGTESVCLFSIISK